jgi:hypothetical protein
LAYCVRSQRYLAHQITAPQIAGAKAIDPAKECDLTSAIANRAADIKVKEKIKLAAISQVNGMKKKARTVSNFISPAPILARKINGVKIRTDRADSGCRSVWVMKLIRRRDPRLINSTRFEMRWWRKSLIEM